MDDRLIPVTGAWVTVDGLGSSGQVVAHARTDAGIMLEVDFGPEVGRRRIAPGQARCGLQVGMLVHDAAPPVGREALGAGRVALVRRLADCDQVLVQLESDGRSVWLPYERLRRVMEPRLRFLKGSPARPDSAERLAVSLMGQALSSWNAVTGALDRLDVDPLPHQIQLVHRIVQSGHANWVIADDVGLGKTVELGLLLAALEARKSIRRVLVVTPASLTRQWQDEMWSKFQRPYKIFGHDFEGDEAWKWKLEDRVIASLDYAKPRRDQDGEEAEDSPFSRLMSAPDWDVVVFDEAHRLSRTDDGGQTLRYRLARELRRRTPALVLLTGTPHQGDTGRFRSLLELVREDLSDAFRMLEWEPEVVGQVVLRNRKIDVTDADGRFIFKGQTVRTVTVDPGPEFKAVDKALTLYLRLGYNAANARGGTAGRAIGFVMTTYRKLASSSVQALGAALVRRHRRLSGLMADAAQSFDPAQTLDEGEGDDLLGEREFRQTRQAFFIGELEMLDELIAACDRAVPHDGKLAGFVRFVGEVVGRLDTKLLVFTEYRATQAYLAAAVEQALGRPPALINGSQSLAEKLAAVAAFNADAPVLISTEAGGEGLNLHRRCHTLLNYDLPWNPARLVQRIGRIYRYGQDHKVTVVNLQAKETIDSDVLTLTLQRIQAIAREMAPVSAEYADRYEAEIVGELLEQIELGEVLKQAFDTPVERSKQRIEEALARAREARERQSEVLDRAVGFDPAALQAAGGFTTGHLAAFVRRAAPFMGVEVGEVSEDGESFTLRLPDALRGRFESFGRRTVVRATTRRRPDAMPGEAVPLDFADDFVRALVAMGRGAEFGAGYAVTASLEFGGEALATFLARWQDDQAQPAGEELFTAARGADGRVVLDNSRLQSLFAGPVAAGGLRNWDRAHRTEVIEALHDRAEAAMAAGATRFKLPNDLLLLGVMEAGA